jgi:hypothetical protein
MKSDTLSSITFSGLLETVYKSGGPYPAFGPSNSSSTSHSENGEEQPARYFTQSIYSHRLSFELHLNIMSVFLEMIADSYLELNTNPATAEPIIFDDSALVNFQLNRLPPGPDTSRSTSPISLSPSFEQGFDWTMSPYDWRVASIPLPESEQSLQQSTSGSGSEDRRKTVS